MLLARVPGAEDEGKFIWDSRWVHPDRQDWGMPPSPEPRPLPPPQPRRSRLDRTFWPVLFVLTAVFTVFAHTTLDLQVQDRLYDFAARHWLVDGHDSAGRLWFYHGPKTVIAALGCGLLALALGPRRWRRRLGFARPDLVIAILTLATLPLLTGLGKRYTGMHCPGELIRYGGNSPYEHLHLSFHAGGESRGRCFPAAHASGGFALLGLAWLRRSARWRIGGVAVGLGAGWWMGGYQMLRGAHFLSHTLVTMLLAWIVVLAWRRVWRLVAVRLHERKFIVGSPSFHPDPA